MPGSDAKARIGLVGCGSWGRLILRDLRSLGCEVAVVARSEASRRRAHEGGATQVVATVAELPACDGHVVASTASSHAEVLDQLADLCLPVFVEKPLTDDLVAAHRIVDRYGDRLFVMDKWRYHRGVLLAAELVADGVIGDVVGITTRRVAWSNPHPDVDPLWTYLPHDLAIGLELLGDLPPVADVRAEVVGGHLIGAHVTLGDDPWIMLEVSTGAPVSHRDLRVVGHDGVIVLPGGYAEALMVSRGAPAGEPELFPFPMEMPLLAELSAFVEHLQGGPPPRSSARDGLRVVECVAAVHERISMTVGA